MPRMLGIDTSGALKELEKVKNVLQLVPEGMEKATLRAMQKTARGIRTDAAKLIRDDYAVRAADVREKFSIDKEYHRSTGEFGIAVTAKGPRSEPLMNFNPRESDAGQAHVKVAKSWKTVQLKKVSVKVKKAGGRVPVKKGFVSTMVSGHKGIFARQGEDRLPIKELYTTSPLRALTKPENTGEIEERAQDRLERNLEHEATYVLQKQACDDRINSIRSGKFVPRQYQRPAYRKAGV